MNSPPLKSSLIAPCGMNCGICRAHLREVNPCTGCTCTGQVRPKTREFCRIKLCRKRTERFCFSCAGFPCDLLQRLDARYRSRFGISQIDNLIQIRESGVRRFLEAETARWISEKGVLCVHDKRTY